MRIPAFSIDLTDLQFEWVDQSMMTVDKAGGPAYFDPVCVWRLYTVYAECRFTFLSDLLTCVQKHTVRRIGPLNAAYTMVRAWHPHAVCIAAWTPRCPAGDVWAVCVWSTFRGSGSKTNDSGYQRDNLVSSNADCTSPHRLYMHAVCKGTNLLTLCFRLYMAGGPFKTCCILLTVCFRMYMYTACFKGTNLLTICFRQHEGPTFSKYVLYNILQKKRPELVKGRIYIKYLV